MLNNMAVLTEQNENIEVRSIFSPFTTIIIATIKITIKTKQTKTESQV